jgi:hypothetical protein
MTDPIKAPSGYLLDGTPVFDLRDVALAHGMSYAECEYALRDFINWTARQRPEDMSFLAGVIRADDPRFYRAQ